MPKKSYIQTILNCFATLDIEGLESNLKKDRTYQEATAEVFLKKVCRILSKHIYYGDTGMLIYKGKCRGKECPNCGKRGYRFVGNLSGNFMDLIFEVEGDDILDIYACEFFEPFADIENLSFRKNPIITEDEKANFVVTPDYLAKLQAASEAWNEIITTPPRKLTFGNLKQWVEKHSATDSIIGSYDYEAPLMKWTDFSILYSELKEISNFIDSNYSKIQEAIALIDAIESEEQLLDWLVKFEECGNEAPYLLKYTFKKEDDYFKWNYKNPICFFGQVFNDVLYFLEYYQKPYSDMFQKYTTYTNEEASILFNVCYTEEEKKQLNSLKFHLENRKTLEAEGISVPLYINLNIEEN